jgi:hypothetical protein
MGLIKKGSTFIHLQVQYLNKLTHLIIINTLKKINNAVQALGSEI